MAIVFFICVVVLLFLVFTLMDVCLVFYDDDVTWLGKGLVTRNRVEQHVQNRASLEIDHIFNAPNEILDDGSDDGVGDAGHGVGLDDELFVYLTGDDVGFQGMEQMRVDDLIIIDGEIGILTHDVDGVENILVNMFIIEINGSQRVGSELVVILIDKGKCAVVARPFDFRDFEVTAVVVIVVVEVFQLGDTHVLFEKLEVSVSVDGAFRSHPMAFGNADNSCYGGVVGRIGPFDLRRLIAEMQTIVAHGFKKLLWHEFVDIGDLLVSVKDGSVIGWVVFHAGTEQREPA